MQPFSIWSKGILNYYIAKKLDFSYLANVKVQGLTLKLNTAYTSVINDFLRPIFHLKYKGFVITQDTFLNTPKLTFLHYMQYMKKYHFVTKN